jgi:small subunit ribosomal protein S15
MTVEEKREIITRFGKDENDTGRTEVQVALLTHRINHLTEHLASTSTITTRVVVC